MDPTSLPTDNLYKFMALGSLAAMVFMIYSGRKLGAELMQQKREAQLEAAKHDLEMESFNEDLKQAKVIGPQEDERFKKIKRRQLEIEHSKKVVNELIDKTKQTLQSGFILGAFFFCTMIVGFALWYTKSQRYQDETTQASMREQKAKADMAELELANAKKKPAAVPPTAAITPASSAAAPQTP